MKATLRLPTAVGLVAAALSCPLVSAEPATVVVTTDADAPAIPYDAGFMRLLVPSSRTDGRSSVLELSELPGFETPWHKHENFDETFHVLEGLLTLKMAGETHVLPAGSTVFIPRGTAHAQGNAGDGPLRLLTSFAPGGFEQFFVDRAELFKRAERGTPEFSRGMGELRSKHAQWIQAADAPPPAND